MTAEAAEVRSTLPEVRIVRQSDAAQFNAVINHPDVHPWVCGPLVGQQLDVTPVMSLPGTHILMGEHGGVMYTQHQPGLYEGHTNVLPAGRGRWALEMARQTIHWMFTVTDAVELVTRVPQGNIPALALTRRVGGELELTQPKAWLREGRRLDVDVYTLSITKWMRTSPGLVWRGRWLNNRIVRAMKKAGVEDVRYTANDSHDRYSGAAIAMIMAGQAAKGMVMYNRWAAMAGFPPIRLLAEAPLTIDLGGRILVVRNNDFWVLPCQ
jgi:hypothetical protein